MSSVASSGTDTASGRVLEGRYVLRSHIADGGMASVWVATDTRLDREVAVKILRPDLSRDAQFVARFKREARAAASLSHPNIVAVHDQGSDHSDHYLTMELVRGRTLREVLRDEGALPVGDALDLAIPILDALAAAHRAGIIHRDIKPENVILREDGEVKVADFGLARAVTAAGTTSATGMLLGTVAYVSPEQVERGVSDARSDVYAAGLLLFEMVTGHPAFAGDTPIHIAFQHVHGSVPAPSSRVSTVPQEIDALVALATARDPDRRPATAGDLLTEVRRSRERLSSATLEARPVPIAATSPTHPTERFDRPINPTAALPALGGEPPRPNGARTTVLDTGSHAAAPDAATPAPRPPGRRRRRLWIAALMVFVLGLGGGVGWWLTLGPGAHTTVPQVAGLSLADASSSLAQHDLRATEADAYSETVAKGTVISQGSPAGTELSKQSEVVLTVSLGQERYPAPKLVGMVDDQVAAALTAGHLSLGQVTEAYDENVPARTVISQNPPEGGSLKPGTAVAVVVSKGKLPIGIPDLTGKPADQARKTLEGLGFVVTEGTAANSDTVPSGALISQSPNSGTGNKGDTITVVISLGPPMVTVPDVTFKSTNDATKALKDAGFKVTVTKLYGGVLGVVRFQSAAGGSQAVKGSTITITVV